MSEGMKTIIYPVKDIARARKLFGALLGVKPQVDEPYYVGFDAGGLHVGLAPNGHAQGMTGGVCYWNVSDIGKSVKQLVDAGAQVQQDAKDVGGGKLVATVKDADGNVIGLIQAS
jgi:predicted enzyme related to lactoylglutathione lyase